MKTAFDNAEFKPSFDQPRGTLVWNRAEYVGSKRYVGTTPTGRVILAVESMFNEMCEWFDGMCKTRNEDGGWIL